jgi:adenine/guanine phosphoribosyltransferase-like PRPP-binding protein
MCYSDAYIKRIDEGDGFMEYSLPRSLRRLEKTLVPVLHEFDVIVVSGLSGVIPGAIFAYMYDKQLVVIRKDDDITHGVRTEGGSYFEPGTPFVVVDDFMSSGATMRRIFEKVIELGYGLPKYVALYCDVWADFTVGYISDKQRISAEHVKDSLYTPFIRRAA